MIDHPAKEGNPRWELVTLRGGPHHRTRVTIPADQDQLVLHEGATAHTYVRTNARPELHHQDRIAGAMGGARR